MKALDKHFDDIFGQTFTTANMANLAKSADTLLRGHLPMANSYPPYNIRKLGDDKYALEIAAAGYSLGEFLIEVENGVLKIECNPAKALREDNFLYQGLSYKKWFRAFNLAEGVVVSNAELVNGILSVWFETVKPPSKKVKINITQPSAKKHPQVLNEDSVI